MNVLPDLLEIITPPVVDVATTVGFINAGSLKITVMLLEPSPVAINPGPVVTLVFVGFT